MKMNRSRSTDSLDNGLNDVATSGSSSPTDFTSDDEAPSLPYGEDDSIKYMRANYTPVHMLELSYGSNKFPHVKRAFQNMASLPTSSNSHNDHLSSPSAKDSSLPESLASTSYYNKKDSNIDDTDPDALMPDVVPGSILSELFKDQEYRDRMRDAISRRRNPEVANNRALANLNDYNVIESNVYLEQNSGMDQNFPFLAGPSRSPNLLACTFCAKLVECTTIMEAIDFIESNRPLINNLTKRVTMDQPAFRDYNMSNYQIDSSVKESFNPNFWLDREPVITTADGNCQYHAVSISLTGNEEHTQEVRLATAVAVVDNYDWFDSMLKLIDRGTVIDLARTIARSYSWGDETTLKAIAVAIKRRIFLYTCNRGKTDYETVMSLSKEELLDAFKEKKYRGGTGIHTYADPLIPVPENNYIMLFHKSEHFIAVLPTSKQPTMFEPYNPIVPNFS